MSKNTDLSSLAVKLLEQKIRKSKSRIVTIVGLVLVLLATAVLYLYPQVQELFAADEPPPVAVINELTDAEKAELLKNKAIVITENVLGEARQRKELLVLEQDIQVESVWESAWGGLDIFKKTKRIVSYGTGYFDIDLNLLDDARISVDHDKQLVTILIPHAALKSISVDEGKTEYEDTQRDGMFGFGELKLTAEQQGLFRKSVEDDMRAQLTQPEILAQADEAGKAAVLDIYSPIVAAVAEGYSVAVAFSQVEN